jgi:pimeloyl-ACP methyl ester carboxylesterase
MTVDPRFVTAMKKILILFAMVGSGIAVVLAVDPGRFAFTYVDAGGHKLRMFISGQGSPAVLFETGGSGAAGGPLEAWERVQPAVSRFARTVAYDRAGIGFSPSGPRPRDARQVALELHTALQNARIAPPYVLVGHSFGGPLTRVFAGMYPSEVAGMVLVDPTQEEILQWSDARHKHHETREGDEWKDIMASLKEAHESRVPMQIPIILITAMKMPPIPSSMTQEKIEDMEAGRQAWLRFHQEWLEQFPNGKHIITENSTHVVPFEQPELIIQAVRDVVEKVDEGRAKERKF